MHENPCWEEEEQKKQILDALEQLYKAPLLNDMAAIERISDHVKDILRKYGRLDDDKS